MPADTTPLKLPGTPKPWQNRAVAAALKVPIVRSLLGRGLILLTVTGARTGRRYTTPVQYVRDGDRLLVMSQRHRIWWRNIASMPDVEILLKGATIATTAALTDADAARDAIATILRLDPRIAKFYGVGTGDDGAPAEGSLDQFDAAFVVIEIALPPDR